MPPATSPSSIPKEGTDGHTNQLPCTPSSTTTVFSSGGSSSFGSMLNRYWMLFGTGCVLLYVLLHCTAANDTRAVSLENPTVGGSARMVAGGSQRRRRRGGDDTRPPRPVAAKAKSVVRGVGVNGGGAATAQKGGEVPIVEPPAMTVKEALQFVADDSVTSAALPPLSQSSSPAVSRRAPVTSYAAPIGYSRKPVLNPLITVQRGHMQRGVISSGNTLADGKADVSTTDLSASPLAPSTISKLPTCPTLPSFVAYRGRRFQKGTDSVEEEDHEATRIISRYFDVENIMEGNYGRRMWEEKDADAKRKSATDLFFLNEIRGYDPQLCRIITEPAQLPDYLQFAESEGFAQLPPDDAAASDVEVANALRQHHQEGSKGRGTAPTAINTTFSNLAVGVLRRIALKSTKLLTTNRGCQEILQFDDRSIHRELHDQIVRDEFKNELVVLEWGSTCGVGADFLARYFANATLDCTVQVMSLQPSIEALRYVRGETIPQARALLNHVDKVNAEARAAQPPSSNQSLPSTSIIKSCPDYGGDLSWLPTETFHFVTAWQSVQNLYTAFKALEQKRSMGKKAPSSTASSAGGLHTQHPICNVVSDLLRATKVGGSVWLGHFTDHDAVKLIVENCVLAITEQDLADEERSQVREEGHTSDGASSTSLSDRYKIEFDVITESIWLGGYSFGISMDMRRGKPRGILLRKIPFNAPPAVTLAIY